MKKISRALFFRSQCI